ncbi:MAG: ABC transporter permease [Phreatobacter sp.]|uniref:ABC transporter permease n=1 Tax=Phreatobacter sp. TaxID=1966341 RepID=UPI001A52F6F6|nr:ABC transporter permease [Phreatobacter sp.]MBL8570281.1 ABC transporter permease [Phreatobacter sp.]
MTALRRQLVDLAYPAAALALAVGAWHVGTVSGAVPSYLLPQPGRVFAALIDGAQNPLVWRHLNSTLQATIFGYVAGSLVALVLAALIAEFRPVERFLIGPLTAIQAIPKVAVAPLVFLWAGFGLEGKTLLVALICFFPVFVNGLVGFRAADANLLDLMRAAGASRFARFMEVKLPMAAPTIFAGLEVAVSFALIGCVVMEFIGATRGMGFLIQDASNAFDLPTVFAAILTLGFIGVAGNAIVRFAHRRVVFWNRATATASTGSAP